MSERDIIAEIRAERAAKEAKRAEDWPKALDKLHITFEASHGGGYPKCLVDRATEGERLRYLRELGFRVRRHFWFETTDDTREEYWSQVNDYTDCSSDLRCNNAISTLTNMGIIDGFSDGTFRPYAKITRAQFA